MAYKIKAVGNDGKNVGTYDFNDETYYKFAVKIDGDERVMEVSRKSDSPPDVGAEYEILKEPPDGTDYRPSLKKPISQGGRPGGGGGGGRAGGGYSPQDIAAMRRSGAQDRAIKMFEIEGRVPSYEELDAWVAYFEGAVNDAVKAAA